MSITKERRVQLKQLQKKISYSFKKLTVLNQALIHKSFINENPHQPFEDNERLEFLGDAVLDVIISHILMNDFPHYAEGDLTKLRSALVNDKRIAHLARELQLGDFLLLGKGEDATKGRNKNSILADTYEAVIAAIYLDGGFKKVFTVVTKHFRYILTAANKGSLHQRDFKSQLQERTQSIFKATPHYILVKEVGPDHNKSFAVSVVVHKKLLGKGFGTSKKDAEQKAAQEALLKLERTHPIKVD
jgi:ribonuclease III